MPLQEDTRFLMGVLARLIDELRAEPVVVECACGAAPSGTLLARLLPESACFATDISVSAMHAAMAVSAASRAQLHLVRMSLLSALRPQSVDVRAPCLESQLLSTDEMLSVLLSARAVHGTCVV